MLFTFVALYESEILSIYLIYYNIDQERDGDPN